MQSTHAPFPLQVYPKVCVGGYVCVCVPRSPAWKAVWFCLPLLVGLGKAPASFGSVLIANPAFFQILLLIDIEQSYINTNHEDFIGFAKYVLFRTAAGGWPQCLPSEPGPKRGGRVGFP